MFVSSSWSEFSFLSARVRSHTGVMQQVTINTQRCATVCDGEHEVLFDLKPN